MHLATINCTEKTPHAQPITNCHWHRNLNEPQASRLDSELETIWETSASKFNNLKLPLAGVVVRHRHAASKTTSGPAAIMKNGAQPNFCCILFGRKPQKALRLMFTSSHMKPSKFNSFKLNINYR